MVYEADSGLMESDLIPYYISEPPGENVLILAPHPDDETLGCGGTIRRLIESGKHVRVIFLTSGDKADPTNKLSHTPPFNSPLNKGGYRGVQGGEVESHITEYSIMREKEAEKALKILGVSGYEFLRFPDRELNANYKRVLERLLGIVEAYIPDTIYSPSMVELNPDHRATSVLSMEIQRIVMKTNSSTLIHDAPPTQPSPSRVGIDSQRGEGWGGGDVSTTSPPPQGSESTHNEERVRERVMPIRIVLYEITTPLRPNILVDITSVYSTKKKAVKRYRSQLRLLNYLRHITALNTVRSLTLNESGYAEAFWCIDEPLEEKDMIRWLSYQCGIKYTKWCKGYTD